MFTIIGADGREYGPVSAAKVAEWIAAGRANLETKARRAGDLELRTLGDFPEFNSAATPPPLPPAALPGATPATAAPVAADTELAGRDARLGAFLLDYVLGILATLPGMLMMGPIFFSLLRQAAAGHEPDLSTVDMAGFGAGLVVMLLGGLVLMVVQVVLLSTRGQTIGKRLLGIRVVLYAGGGPAGFLHAWLLRNVVPFLIQLIPWIGFAFWIVDVCFIFTAERRCLHDLIAGTKVVKI